MSDFPLLSAVMPTKNRRSFVLPAIASFLAQDYQGRMEIVIVEDGEDDSSSLLGQSWGLNGETRDYNSFYKTTIHGGIQWIPVRYCRFKGTLGAKLNFGAQVANGELIANWDDDDWYAPGRLTAQLAHMRLTSKPVVACCSGLFWDGIEWEAFEYHGASTYGFGASFLYRRDWALAHPHADITLGEDSAFASIAHEAGDLSTMSGLDLMVFRNHPGNTSPLRDFSNPRIREALLMSENWRQVPFSRVETILKPQ